MNLSTQYSANKISAPIRESDFYVEIRNSVDSHSKSDFSFLMSMLSHDVLDSDQFNQVTSSNNLNEQTLRDILGVKEKVIEGEINAAPSVRQNQMVHENQIASVRLSSLLQNEALFFRGSDTPNDLPSEVIENIDLNTKARLYRDMEINSDTTLNKQSSIHSIERPNSMDIDMWLNSINAARALDLVS
jgi:hypothetical protein